MNTITETQEVLLEPADNAALANLCGQFDEHLRQIERRLGIHISNRGNHFRVMGPAAKTRAAARVLRELYDLAGRESIDAERVHVCLQESSVNESDDEVAQTADAEQVVRTRRLQIRPRGANQRRYLAGIRENDLCFGIGPAGTGKTYLAVASAVEALEQDQVRRIVLVRPAVEAGERLGFLPGDMSQKVDPYLRPMYDALYEMIGFDRVARLVDRNIIEVAPLAFMRGRSLNESFIILDEAQNTTVEQMKMFLTRMGFGSRAVVTGDITQIDLPRNATSGLRHVIRVLDGVNGVDFTYFSPRDVVRHALVQRIVEAYETHENGAGKPAPGTDG
ncbi:MAG: PhoH family protein [Gammaproteobacteria bacterium]|nr:PhoH family protein [Gammaproteobacteria bacterium]